MPNSVWYVGVVGCWKYGVAGILQGNGGNNTERWWGKAWGQAPHNEWGAHVRRRHRRPVLRSTYSRLSRHRLLFRPKRLAAEFSRALNRVGVGALGNAWWVAREKVAGRRDGGVVWHAVCKELEGSKVGR